MFLLPSPLSFFTFNFPMWYNMPRSLLEPFYSTDKGEVKASDYLRFVETIAFFAFGGKGLGFGGVKQFCIRVCLGQTMPNILLFFDFIFLSFFLHLGDAFPKRLSFKISQL